MRRSVIPPGVVNAIPRAVLDALCEDGRPNSRPSRYRDRLRAIGSGVQFLLGDESVTWMVVPFIFGGATIVAIKELPGVRQAHRIIFGNHGREFNG